MAQIKVEDTLNSEKFRKLHELSYDKITAFVFENIRLRTVASRFYFLINIFVLVIIVWLAAGGHRGVSITFGDFLKQFGLGFLGGTFIVIPFHEGFHGLAYKLAGAPKVHFGSDLKQMIFYVSADRYVLNRQGFYFVALAPFVMINLSIAGLYIFTGWPGLFTGLFFLFFHNLMCIGDFAMISYFEKNADRELYTWDDHGNRISYIYEKLPAE